MLRLLLSVAVAAGVAAAASAQAIRGNVRTVETRIPLPFSTVVLQPGGIGQFTDDSGAFTIPVLPAGAYHLTIRAIGYLPFDTTLRVAADPIVLHIGLVPLAIELPPVTVLARACLRPGPPVRDSEPELAAIFDQLRDNAARYRLLSDAYPFRYWLERQTADSPPPPRHGPGVGRPPIDTLELQSDVRQQYKPGGLIVDQPGPHGHSERTLRLPTVVDLADSVFHRSHCFTFAGIDTVNGRSQWRIDFLAAERLKAPDVAGSAWLDGETYELRRLVFRLTRPEKAMSALHHLEVTVVFDELVRSLTVPTHIEAYSEGGKGRNAFTGREDQRLLRIEFLRAAPGLTPRP
jgi:carboxypeptidase-like protein